MSVLAAVLIPTYDEAADIEGCLAAVAAQDVGAAAIEVIVADGQSDDGTPAIAAAAAPSFGFGRFEVVPNPDRRTAAGLHRALDAVTAAVVVRVDARSRIGPGHVRRALAVLAERPDIGVVGGAQVPEAPGSGTVAQGIARALGNRYTTGLSRYRRTDRSGPADTVWMGAFRTAELRRLGGWDPEHGINEDYELNRRYRAAGFTVWFDAGMAAGYRPRADLPALARQYLGFGRAKGAQWRGGARPAPRHLALLAAPPAAGGMAAVAARRVGLGPVLVGAVLAALLVDHLGSRRSAAPPGVRCAALVATVTFQAAWWAGALTAYLRPPDPTRAPARR